MAHGEAVSGPQKSAAPSRRQSDLWLLFASDVLGPWALDAPTAFQAYGDGEDSQTQSMGSQIPPQAASSSSQPPPPPPRADEDTKGHEWHWQGGRWLCKPAFVVSYGGAPTPKVPRAGGGHHKT